MTRAFRQLMAIAATFLHAVTRIPPPEALKGWGKISADCELPVSSIDDLTALGRYLDLAHDPADLIDSLYDQTMFQRQDLQSLCLNGTFFSAGQIIYRIACNWTCSAPRQCTWSNCLDPSTSSSPCPPTTRSW